MSEINHFEDFKSRNRLHVMLLFFVVLFSVAPSYGSSIVGSWKFYELIYQGNRIPRPNPELNLIWSFDNNGVSRLYWDRGGVEFCERTALYSVRDSVIYEKVIAVNSENAPECAQDPDMKVGKESTLQFQINNEELFFYIQLGDDDIIYVMTPVKPSGHHGMIF